jgi:hypothetical protein
VTRWLLLVLAVYAPHLVEEALTGMHDDPIIVAAFTPFASLSARHAAYLVFQLMLALSLGVALLTSLGGPSHVVLRAGLAVALVAESHHILRALVAHTYNSGLITSLPMPVVGALLARRVLSTWHLETPAALARPSGVLT